MTTTPPAIEIAVEPAYNVLNSMALLSNVEQKPALDAWILRTAAALSEQQRQQNTQVFGALRAALLIEGNWPDFPSYLAALDKQLSTDHREQIVPHLRELWEQHFAAEWKRTSAALENQTRPLLNNRLPEWKRAHLIKQGLPTTPDQYLAPGVRSIEESLRALIGPELWSNSEIVTAATTRVIYVNSAHNGRYTTWFHTGTTLRIFFNALRNFPALLRTAPVSRSELAGRLNALADETRLAILGLFDHQDTLSAQEIMAQLDLTQSTASRQLRPLTAFLNESRGKGANKHYIFSPAQLELTFQAVRDLIENGEAATGYDDARLAHPEPLRRYMNREGKLTMLPLRQADRQAALAFLAEQIEPLRDYTEKEINALIQNQLAFDDFATIRRELYNNRFLDREPNGSRYWKGARE